MSRFRNYWIYSAGLAVVWAVLLMLVFTTRGPAVGQTFVLIFAGFSIGWVTTTIARFVYPPPKRWGATHHGS
ncbi:hypothetical protein AB6813_14395 [bacterium RCC_150]